jgi:transposase InsO family protein
VHHSDRGSQNSSEQFQRLVADHGVVCSMRRSGNVRDNAAMESIFMSLKTARTAAKAYRSRDEAEADVLITLAAILLSECCGCAQDRANYNHRTHVRDAQ